MAFAVQSDMVLPPIHLLGTEEQKKKYLEPGLKGQKVGSLGITEPGAGSDVAGIRTTAIRDGDEYVINGSKTFITNGPRADFIVLVCKTNPEERHAGITLFIVDLKDEEGNLVPGFSVSAELEKLGMHASDTGELAFEDVRVPAGAILGEEGKGFYHISWELQGERLVAAAGCHAGAERMIEKAVDYAKEREAFGRPIGKFQALRHKIAEMATKTEAVGRRTARRSVAAEQDGRNHDHEADQHRPPEVVDELAQPFEVSFHTVETLVDGVEASVHVAREIIEPVVGPSPSQHASKVLPSGSDFSGRYRDFPLG
jgi:citronellyl-CoA dehydrogenase